MVLKNFYKVGVIYQVVNNNPYLIKLLFPEIILSLITYPIEILFLNTPLPVITDLIEFLFPKATLPVTP